MANRYDIIFSTMDDVKRPRGDPTDVFFRSQGYEGVEPGFSRFREVSIADSADFPIFIYNRLRITAFQKMRKVSRAGTSDKTGNSPFLSGDVHRGSCPTAEAYQVQSLTPEALHPENIVGNCLQVAGPTGHIQISAAISSTPEIKEKDGVPMRTNAFRQLRITAITGLRGIARRYAMTKANGGITGIIIRQEILTDYSYTVDLKCKVV